MLAPDRVLLLNVYLWPIDRRTLSGANTLGQIEPGSDGNEEVVSILQSSSITEASSSDCLVSYPRYSLRETYPYVEIAGGVVCSPSQLGQVNLGIGVIYKYLYIKTNSGFYRLLPEKLVSLWSKSEYKIGQELRD